MKSHLAHPRHLFSIDDLGRDGILSILDRARELRAEPHKNKPLAGMILGLLIFQASTRTRFGFSAAMARLGGLTIELNEAKFQPGMTLAESLPDTIRCISAYCDIIVIRHQSSEQILEAVGFLCPSYKWGEWHRASSNAGAYRFVRNP